MRWSEGRSPGEGAVDAFMVIVKWDILFRESMVTEIESLPETVRGRAVMNSELWWIKCREGITGICKRPAGSRAGGEGKWMSKVERELLMQERKTGQRLASPGRLPCYSGYPPKAARPFTSVPSSKYYAGLVCNVDVREAPESETNDQWVLGEASTPGVGV
ncbi:hypothetical protein, conserved [Eimeria brunetti]|uniref:Uncharacterized protein n=1 Tax=Eimeria brunetti TaxID=51314 RepID=U6LFU0_9EIME|nr:hypothetical protein, conserved [Eimeria brunetti]